MFALCMEYLLEVTDIALPWVLMAKLITSKAAQDTIPGAEAVRECFLRQSHILGKAIQFGPL